MQAAYNETPAPAAFSAAREKFDEMARHLESRAGLGMTHDELEGYVIREGRELERRMLQAHLDLRASAELPVRVVSADGAERFDRRRGERTLRSLVGPVVVTRLLYQTAGASALAPQDASLNLPDESFSLGVRRRTAEEVASASFEHAVERLNATTGATVAKRQVEELAQRAAEVFNAFYAERPLDVDDEEGMLLVLTFDGAGITMRHEDLRDATRRAAE